MSRKPQSGQRTSAEPAQAAVAEDSPFRSPLVMVTSTNKVYVTDRTITRWEEVSVPAASPSRDQDLAAGSVRLACHVENPPP